MSFDRNALPPDYRLLLLCANDPNHPPDEAAVHQTAAAVGDWAFVTVAAKEHRLAPLLFHWLSRHAAEVVPDTVLRDLENHGRERAFHMMRMVGYLKKVLSCLHEADIQAMVLKGPILGQRVFGNMALRPSNDLDILVRAEDRDRAYERLQKELGFDTDFHELSKFSDRQRRHFLAYSHELSLGHSHWKLVLDLHWRTSRFELSQFSDFGSLYERADLVPFTGVEVPYFRYDDLLVYLAAHGSRHSWLRLFWLNDLAALVRGDHIPDWDQVLRTADKHQQRRSLLMGLYLCRLFFELPLPPPVTAALASEPELQARALSLLPYIFPEKREVGSFPLHLPVWFGLRWLSSLSDSRRRRWSTLAQFAFVPNERDWERLHLPDVLFPAYYLFRPLRLAWQYTFRK